MTNIALVAYPLTDDYQLRLEKCVGGPVTCVPLTNFRSRRLDLLIRDLRSLRPDRLLLPVQDGSYAAILPLMQIIAMLSRARSIALVTPDLQCVNLPRLTIAMRVVKVLGASVGTCFAAARSCYELLRLLQQPRTRMTRFPVERVLYLKTNLGFGVKAGGSVGHVNGVISGLIRRQYEVDFASGEPMPMNIRGFSSLPVHIPPLGVPGEFNHYRFQHAIVRQVVESVPDRRHDFIYHRLSVCNYAGVVLSRRLKLPLVLEYNGSEVWVARHWGHPLRFEKLARRAEDACLRHAHLVVTVSDALERELIERGVPQERIVFYPNCVDAEMFNPVRFGDQASAAIRERVKIEPDATVITFIGTFGAWHGVEALARTISHLVENDRQWLETQKVRFLLIGDGLKMPQVREILRDDRYVPFYRLTGLIPQTDAPDYLAASNILVSPHVRNPDGSQFFGSPTKLFEYMAMAKPIVASDLGQIGQVLAAGLCVGDLPTHAPASNEQATAILTEPGNISALAQAMRFLVEHPEWQAVLGSNARKLVLSRYTWEHHVGAVLHRLDTLFPKSS